VERDTQFAQPPRDLTLLPCTLVREGHLLRRPRAAPLHGDRRGRHKTRPVLDSRQRRDRANTTPL